MGVPRRRLCVLVLVAVACSAAAASSTAVASSTAMASFTAMATSTPAAWSAAVPSSAARRERAHVTASMPPTAGQLFCAGTDSVFFSVPRHERIVSQRDARVCIDGSVTVRFHGSRRAGCAARGLLDYAGSEVWHPGGGDLTLAVVERHGHRAVETVYATDDARPAAEVTRIVGGHVRGTCRDRGFAGDLEARLQPVDAGLVSFRPARAGVDHVPSRCGGPVDADLPMMPATQLPLAAVMRRREETHVVAQRRFARGGFAGTVAAHLSITVGRPGRSFSGGHAPYRGPATRIVTVSYRIATSTGSIAVSWSHPPAGCALLDACELRGTERVGLRSPAGSSRRLTLVAEGPRAVRSVTSWRRSGSAAPATRWGSMSSGASWQARRSGSGT